MNAPIRNVFAVVLAGIVTTACARSVEIEHPPERTLSGPVSEFRVKFHSRFEPGTFSADINGIDYTSQFIPTPAPGITSTAPAPGFPVGTSVLRVSGDFSPSRAFDMHGDTAEFTPPALIVCRPPPCGRTTGIGVPVLTTVSVGVTIPSAPPSPLQVRITPSNNFVSLNNQPAGASIVVTIPSNDRRTSFSVRGIQQGIIYLLAESLGYQAVQTGGRVF